MDRIHMHVISHEGKAEKSAAARRDLGEVFTSVLAECVIVSGMLFDAEHEIALAKTKAEKMTKMKEAGKLASRLGQLTRLRDMLSKLMPMADEVASAVKELTS